MPSDKDKDLLHRIKHFLTSPPRMDIKKSLESKPAWMSRSTFNSSRSGQQRMVISKPMNVVHLSGYGVTEPKVLEHVEDRAVAGSEVEEAAEDDDWKE